MYYEDYNRKFNLGNIKKIDKISLALLGVLSIVSLVVLSSAGGNDAASNWAIKQAFFILFGMGVMIIITSMNIKFVFKLAYIAYAVSIGLLVIVEFTGDTAMGATRWIDLKIIKIQPSEIAKICLILMLARYFNDLNRLYGVNKIKTLIIPLALIAVPTLLVVKQPDLGTSIVLIICGIIMLFLAGLHSYYFMASGAWLLVMAPVAWNMMHDYQKNRIVNFMNPENDPLGSGYNIIQSKIAVGSGGFLGKGYANGTQSQLDFLPEKHTDFAFTMFGEEFGFVGCVLLLCIYLTLIFRLTILASESRQYFGKLLGIGLASLISVHVIVNAAMVLGLLPVVGLPMPLLSYGGSVTLNAFVICGIVFNININRNYSFTKTLGKVEKYKYMEKFFELKKKSVRKRARS